MHKKYQSVYTIQKIAYLVIKKQKNTKLLHKEICIDKYYCKILENVEVFTRYKNYHKNNIAIVLQSAYTVTHKG